MEREVTEYPLSVLTLPFQCAIMGAAKSDKGGSTNVEKGSLSVTLWMIVAPLKAKAQTNDPPPSGSCYVSPFSSNPESNLDSVVQYSRRGNHIWEVTPTSAEDWDYCVFCGFFAPYGVRIVNWTDFDAGGEFGYSPDGVHFYPFDLSQDNPELAERVNAYRTNPNFWGILKIAPRLDDIPSFCSFCGMPTYNDDPVIGDPWRMTVWEFEIDPPYIDALPQDGATYTFTATIRPEKDHYGNSMARVIEFELDTSAEPGYCMNATREQGLWTDTTAQDNDLKFVPYQPGLEVYADGAHPTNYSIARTVEPVLSASVQVRCLDYGAYGSVSAHAIGLGFARLKGTLIERGAMIPRDENNNGIYDGWIYESRPEGDQDTNPPYGSVGDGVVKYEEYRGFMINGSYFRSDPGQKMLWLVPEEGNHAVRQQIWYWVCF